MQIIFGGAFNGKRQYVKENLTVGDYCWCEGTLPDTSAESAVIAGLEKWVEQQLLLKKSEVQIMQQINEICLRSTSSNYIWILTDMNRGIVPMDALERQMRDVIGRIYQFLFKEAKDVIRIWYGIPQTIKGADQDENLYENRG
ncbi:bifunctional adenosylcobinamide kinase/adenosylcobinamide-phosphate guanylyltransferase [Planomicrobium okeanokoites]|uniref:bifunctional adenosylcobinamide kinase/adenosylcobinamide-phosphate guanylyltransferase n=1 Tax=Planomicrobium okeanokoites TaxID=244 RepID=UPI0009FC1D01|nr:bifunctional adenosylcobinamide kinase/adenosylcobinamide-phosphate guanylyltransferase [Planomicrobium okeanokoites]